MPSQAFLVIDSSHTRRSDLLRRYALWSADGGIAAPTLWEASALIAQYRPRIIAVAAELCAEQGFQAVLQRAQECRSDVVTFGGRSPATAAIVADHFENADAVLDHLRRRHPLLAQPPGIPIMSQPIRDMICIGASTGGITALEVVLTRFPEDCPPTLIVQHIRPGFAEGLVRRLDQILSPRVVAAVDGTPLSRGTVYVATAADRHLGVVLRAGPRLRLVAGDPVSGHRPSVDILFEQSAALAPQLHVSAALLTGMGADGAAGLAALRAAGGYTIAQDEASSVVWGMPRVAIERGAAVDVLPLERIGPALLRKTMSGEPTT